jgi:hypothetical protein
MQSFGNADRLGEGKRRSMEGRTETLIRLRARLTMNWCALARRAQRSVVEFSHGSAREKHEGQQDDPDERLLPLHRAN